VILTGDAKHNGHKYSWKVLKTHIKVSWKLTENHLQGSAYTLEKLRRIALLSAEMAFHSLN